MNQIKFLLPLIIIFTIQLNAQNKKVIVFAIDGMRADLLCNFSLSFFEKMKYSGIGSYATNNIDISISGPSWASVTTGVYHSKHKVVNNKFIGANTDRILSIPRLNKKLNPRIRSGMFMEWDRFYDFNKDLGWDTLIAGQFGNTKSSTDIISHWVKNSDLDYYFIYLGEPDFWGHRLGFETWNPFYTKAYKNINYAIEAIITSLNQRTTIQNEEWLMITTTDHGGKGFHHDGNSIQERQVFWFASYLTNYNSVRLLESRKNKVKNSYTKCNQSIEAHHADICITTLDYFSTDKICKLESELSYTFDGSSWLNLLNSVSADLYCSTQN